MDGTGEGKQAAAGGRSLRVLVVEDEFIVSLSLQAQLKAAGCEVVGVAGDASEAVEMARSCRPDVVLMDIGLPGRDGVAATEEIMAEAPTRVIMVTAYGDERVDRALKAGARKVLTKPILGGQLTRAIAEVTADLGDEATES